MFVRGNGARGAATQSSDDRPAGFTATPGSWPRRLMLIAGMVSVLVLGFALGAPGANAQAANASVSITDFQFTPASVTVSVGGSVSWSNNSPTPHTVTSSNGAFDSGIMNAGQAFSFTFTSPGTFAYTCTIHPQMTGTVVVQAAAPAGGGTTTTPAAGATTAPQGAPATGNAGPASNDGGSMDLMIAGAVLAAIGAAVLFAFTTARSRR